MWYLNPHNTLWLLSFCSTAAVKCYVRKTRFVLCRQGTQMVHHYRRHCSRVSVPWREKLFRFLFSGTIIVCLTRYSLNSLHERVLYTWSSRVLYTGIKCTRYERQHSCQYDLRSAPWLLRQSQQGSMRHDVQQPR